MGAFRDKSEYWLVAAFLRLVRMLPVSASYRLGAVVARLYYWADRSRRRLTLENLRHAFPERDGAELRRIARACYRNAAYTAVQGLLVLSGKHGREEILSMVDGTQWEGVEDTDEDRDFGKLVITAHFGDWEMMSHYVAIRASVP